MMCYPTQVRSPNHSIRGIVITRDLERNSAQCDFMQGKKYADLYSEGRCEMRSGRLRRNKVFPVAPGDDVEASYSLKDTVHIKPSSPIPGSPATLMFTPSKPAAAK